MKITKSQLKQIIKEELPKLMRDIPGVVFTAYCPKDGWSEEGFETLHAARLAADQHDRTHHKRKPTSSFGMRRPNQE